MMPWRMIVGGADRSQISSVIADEEQLHLNFGREPMCATERKRPEGAFKGSGGMLRAHENK